MEGRELFVRDVQNALIGAGYNHQDIMNIVYRCMDAYEIQERCTEVAPPKNSINYAMQLYAASLITEGKAPGTVKNYRRIVEGFLTECGKELDDIRALDVKIWMAKQCGHIKKSTAENRRLAVNAFFEWCAREEILVKNPMKAVRAVKQDKVIRLALSETEIDMLRGSCNTLRERAEIEVLLSTGLRAAELCALDMADIDFTSLTVHVRHGKGGKDRIVYMSELAAAHLKNYLNTRMDNGVMVFCARGGSRLSTRTLADNLDKIAARCGVTNVHPHRFRRTFATTLHKRGMDLHSIQLLMGHASVNTTMSYISAEPKLILAEFQKCA